MFPGKKTLTVTMALSLVVAILIAGLGAADATYAAPPTQEPAPHSTAIPYAGQLNNAAGQPVADGIYDFTFSLYDAPTGGDLLWTGTQAGVTVQGGSFSASLGSDTGLPKAVLDRKECWLAVSVRGPDESGFTALEPRQLLPTDGPAAVSALSCPHSHFTDSWPGSNPVVWPLLQYHRAPAMALRAFSNATAWNYAAVYGANTAATGYGTGVYGYSLEGTRHMRGQRERRRHRSHHEHDRRQERGLRALGQGQRCVGRERQRHRGTRRQQHRPRCGRLQQHNVCRVLPDRQLPGWVYGYRQHQLMVWRLDSGRRACYRWRLRWVCLYSTWDETMVISRSDPATSWLFPARKWRRRPVSPCCWSELPPDRPMS